MKVEPKEDDFATKMLKKMGWKEGSGLGKDGQVHTRVSEGWAMGSLHFRHDFSAICQRYFLY